jgi:hypothetical protein
VTSRDALEDGAGDDPTVDDVFSDADELSGDIADENE